MPIVVPQYSDSRGRAELPQGRFTPLSANEISNFGAPGRALARFGDQIADTAQKGANLYIQMETKRMTDEGRVWVINARNELLTNAEQHREEISRTLTRGELVTDRSSPGNPDPNTMVGRTSSWVENQLRNYTPPSKIAQQMWNEEVATIRGNLVRQAIRDQAAARTAAIRGITEDSLNSASLRVMRDPSQLQAELDALSRFTQGSDNPATPELEGINGTVSAAFLDATNRTGRAALADAALVGLVNQNRGLEAIRIIDRGEYDNGNMYGLSPERLGTIRRSAVASLELVNREALTRTQARLADHIASLESGGSGLPEFQNPASVGDSIRATFLSHPDLQELVPNLYDRIQGEVVGLTQDFESRARVARAVGGLVRNFENAPQSEILNFQRRVLDVGKGEAVTTESLGGRASDAAYTYGGLNNLSTSERVTAMTRANQILTSRWQQRATDPAEFVLNNDLVQNQLSQAGIDTSAQIGPDGRPVINTAPGATNDSLGTLAQWQQRVSVMDAAYENMGTPQGSRVYLTNAEASAMVTSIKNRTQSPEALIATLNALPERFGSSFTSIWRQLTTMRDGLDARYMFLATIAHSPAANLFAQGMLTDQQSIRNSLASSQVAGNGITYSTIETQVVARMQPLMEAMTGGLSNRVQDTGQLMSVFTNAAALLVATGQARTDMEAANRLYESFTAGGLYTVQHDDRMWAVFTPEHRDSGGLAVVGAMPNAMQNGRRMLRSQESIRTAVSGMGLTLLPPSSGNDVIAGDPALRMSRYLDKIVETGRWVMSDDGEGMMLVYNPYGLTMSPVTVTGHGGGARPFVLPFDAFTADPRTNPLTMGR